MIFCSISSIGGVRFSFRGRTYQNNSFVFLEDIGQDSDALLCITNQTACCHPGGMGTGLGNWFFPNGTRVPNEVVNSTSGLKWDFYRTWGEMVVLVHRRRGGVEGIYRCEIPDAMNVTQIIYIGVYTRSEWYMYTFVLINYSRTTVCMLK